MFRHCLAAPLTALALAAPADAGGDLATPVERLEVLRIGLGDNGYGVSQTEFRMETGKAYRLMIEAVGFHECAWEAPAFFRNVWLRKIEAGGMEIKVPYIHELEMEADGEAELFFVPIRPGTYDWGCRGLAERGLAGVFVVE